MKGYYPWFLGIFMLAVLFLLIIISAGWGYANFSYAQVLELIISKITGSASSLNESQTMLLWDSRFPRIFTALLAGGALALSGVIYQALLLNPLADPYTLGVSSGAACGASLTILLGISSPLIMSLGAFSLAFLTLIAVMLLAMNNGRLAPTNLILAGVIMSSILSAALSFQKYLAGEQVSSIIFWLLGSFVARTWIDAFTVLCFSVPTFLIAFWYAIDLNLMTLGLKSAETLGVNTKVIRFVLLVAASITAAAVVSVSGIIGFVGLIVPHLIRLLTGPDHRMLLPLSFLGGAIVLLAADSFVRVLLPGEIPVGVLTALLAGPLFLVIFRRRMGQLSYEA